MSFYMCLLPTHCHKKHTDTYTHNSHFMYEDFNDFINSPNIRDSRMSLCNFQQLKFGKEHTSKRNNVKKYSKSQSSVHLFERNGPGGRNCLFMLFPMTL